MKTQFLAFTNYSFAYAPTKEKARKLLETELKKRFASADFFHIADVTNVNDGAEILHEFGKCTANGEDIPTEKVNF